jgi:hypothetical protein
MFVAAIAVVSWSLLSNSPQAVWSELLNAMPLHSTHTALKPPSEKKPFGHLLQLPVGEVSPKPGLQATGHEQGIQQSQGRSGAGDGACAAEVSIGRSAHRAMPWGAGTCAGVLQLPAYLYQAQCLTA